MGFSCGLLCLQGLLHGLDLPGCESRHLGGGLHAGHKQLPGAPSPWG